LECLGLQVVLLWVVTAYGVLERLRYVFAPYLFCSPRPSPSTPRFFGFVIVFSINFFSNSGFVGLTESTSLWVGIPIGVRLLTAGSPQTPRKRDPHWVLLLLLLVCVPISHHYKALDVFKRFVAEVETQLERRVKILRTD